MTRIGPKERRRDINRSQEMETKIRDRCGLVLMLILILRVGYNRIKLLYLY